MYHLLPLKQSVRHELPGPHGHCVILKIIITIRYFITTAIGCIHQHIASSILKPTTSRASSATPSIIRHVHYIDVIANHVKLPTPINTGSKVRSAHFNQNEEKIVHGHQRNTLATLA